MLKADLHLHTGEDVFHKLKYNAKELIDYMVLKGFDIIAITCHGNVFYNKEITDYAKKKGILLIPGTERFIEGKEVLIYNLTQTQAKKIHTFQDLRQLKKQQDLLVIAPHPFFLRKNCLGKKLEKNIELFDGIEYSHFYVPLLNRNKPAVKIANKHNKPLIGNSDAHSFANIGFTYTMIDSKKDIKSVFEAIRDKKTSLETKPVSYKYFLKKIFQVVLDTE